MSTPTPEAAAGSCSRDTCWAPETACVLGKNPCENFSAAATPEGAVGPTGPTLPWSGLPLGLNDLTAVAATARHRLVALVGLADAGKTTALAAHWIAAEIFWDDAELDDRVIHVGRELGHSTGDMPGPQSKMKNGSGSLNSHTVVPSRASKAASPSRVK